MLLCHIQQALDYVYIEPFIDDDTNILSIDISRILEHLFICHGKIRGEKVKIKDIEILHTLFTPSDPLVPIWNPNKKLAKFAAQPSFPYTEHQRLNLPCNSSKSHVILSKLSNRNNEPTGNKTSLNIKSYLREEQEKLNAMCGPSMVQAGFTHDNHFSLAIRDEMMESCK